MLVGEKLDDNSTVNVTVLAEEFISRLSMTSGRLVGQGRPAGGDLGGVITTTLLSQESYL